MNTSTIKIAVFRLMRALQRKKGIYCKYGKDNHFSQGCVLYENTSIGNGNYFAPYVISNNTVIGNFCSIGPSCKLGLADHDLQAVSTAPRINNGREEMKLFFEAIPTIIEHDVWLGANVVVKQGVKIGTGAVVGANSVVLHDIPPYAIAVGAPAKVIKYRFSDDRTAELISSRWYLASSIAEAKEIIVSKGLSNFKESN